MDTLKLIHIINKEYASKFHDSVWFNIDENFQTEDFYFLKEVLHDEGIKVFENKKLKLKLHKDDRIQKVLECFKTID